MKTTCNSHFNNKNVEYKCVTRLMNFIVYWAQYADIMSTDEMSKDIMSNRQNAEQTKCRQTPCMQNTEETIAKYAVDANLFRLRSTNPKKNIQL